MFKYEMKTASDTYSHLKKYLKSSDIILDVGSGTGFVADLISEKTRASVVRLDVAQDKNARQKSILFDGKTMPFYDEAFTVSICCFVLHHTPFQKELIEEMKRVTKSRIIILEDVIETPADHFLLFLHKIYSGFRYNSFYTLFRNDHGWRKTLCHVRPYVDKELNIEKTREIDIPGFKARLFVDKKMVTCDLLCSG